MTLICTLSAAGVGQLLDLDFAVFSRLSSLASIAWCFDGPTGRYSYREHYVSAMATNNRSILDKKLSQLLGFEEGVSDVVDHLLTIESSEVRRRKKVLPATRDRRRNQKAAAPANYGISMARSRAEWSAATSNELHSPKKALLLVKLQRQTTWFWCLVLIWLMHSFVLVLFAGHVVVCFLS